ncbi:hypothetical protein BJV74DRAFT_861534 [Russula compacta]|nr:hypothetical protein BJV74DRAFT_861534 [Russula compacta]
MSDAAAELLLELYETYKETAYSNLMVGVVVGLYVVLYGTSLYILLRDDGMLRSAPRLFMLVVTTTMFALGLAALVLQTSLSYQQFTLTFNPSSTSLWSPRYTDIITTAGAIIACIIYIISDVVGAWRAAVVWNYNRKVVAVLTLFVLGTTAAAGSDLGLNFHCLFGPTGGSIQGDNSAKLGGYRTLILVGPMLATNFLSTSLIGIQVWRKRHVLINHLSRNSVAIRVEKILAMLIESGFPYCCIWILYLISTFQVIPQPGYAVIDAVLLYVSGLYPTVVIIFVVLRMSPTSSIAKRPASMHVSDPSLPATAGTRIPMSIIYTQHEGIRTDSDMTVLPSPILHPFHSKDKL